MLPSKKVVSVTEGISCSTRKQVGDNDSVGSSMEVSKGLIYWFEKREIVSRIVPLIFRLYSTVIDD